jgi:predicted O-methyltransferase YrrM
MKNKISINIDWFSNNIPRMEQLVKPYLAKFRKVHILDIAPHTGISTVWFLENIPNCHVTVLQPSNIKAVVNRMFERLEPYKNRVTVLEGGVELIQEGEFDFIYIDIIGSDSRGTLEAAVRSFPLLKSGGLMAFDDYTTDRTHGYACPKPAIDSFTNIYSRYIKIFHASWQLLLVKRRRPLQINPCKSEYYHENITKV